MPSCVNRFLLSKNCFRLHSPKIIDQPAAAAERRESASTTIRECYKFHFHFISFFFLFDFSFVHSLTLPVSLCRWDGILFERRCERNKLLSSDFFKCIIIRCIVELDTQWQQQQNDGYKNIYYKQRVRYSITIPLKCPYCPLALCVSDSYRIISVRAERVYLGWQN